jgi:hypothetical protein
MKTCETPNDLPRTSHQPHLSIYHTSAHTAATEQALTMLSQPPLIHTIMHHSDLPSDALLRLSQLVHIYLVMQYFGSPGPLLRLPRLLVMHYLGSTNYYIHT